MGRDHRILALDGLRGLSALCVALAHCQVPGFARGGIGVDVFFVLSGYLITGLIKQEVDQGVFQVARFWTRRLKRLLPALFGGIALAIGVTFAALPHETSLVPMAVLTALSYTTNIWRDAGGPYTALSHTWTLAVEMQFYLLWPLILPAILRLRHRSLVLVLLWAAMTLAALAVYARPPGVNGFITTVHASGLVLGAAFALMPPSRPLLGWIGAGAALVVLFWPLDALGEILGRPAYVQVAAAVLVATLTRQSLLSRALAWRPLVALGAISYGVYIYHFPIMCALQNRPWWLQAAIVLPMSIALARLSYLTVEAWATRHIPVVTRRAAAQIRTLRTG